MHVLFVCTGNICRSPTAERLAAGWVSRRGVTNFTTASAGTRAVVGHPMHSKAAVVLDGLGGDASAFAARQLTPRIASQADLILTMTTAHRDSVLEIAPSALRRTFTLGEAAQLISEHGADSVSALAALRAHATDLHLSDIPDPIGQERAFFEIVGSQIAALLRPALELCCRAAGAASG